MNNLPQPPDPLVDREGRITPHFLVNCDAHDTGVLKEAQGYKLNAPFADIHSIAGEESELSVMLGVINGVLTRIEPESGLITPLCSVGPKSRMNYVQVTNWIYFSSRFFNGIYDTISGQIRPWGLPPPGMPPDVSLCAGDMPPGKYDLCYTRISADGLSQSGNGPIRQIEFEDQAAGLQLNNLEGDFQVWITQVNGGPMFQAEINSQGQVTNQVPDFNPLRTLNIIPPPQFRHFTFDHGRIWGVMGRNLYYSEPNEYGDFGWFSRKYIPFLEDLVLVASFTGGLYVNSRNLTWVLRGTEPDKFKIESVGIGAIPGTLCLAQIPAKMASGAVPTQEFAEFSMMPTPVWRNRTGFVIGTHGGHLILVTERRLKLSDRQYGASLWRWNDGIPQVITTARGPTQNPDAETEEILAMGALFAAPVTVNGASGLLMGSQANLSA
jgi:hypothetical protein